MQIHHIVAGYISIVFGVMMFILAAAINVHNEYNKPMPPHALDIVGKLEHAELEDSSNGRSYIGDVRTYPDGRNRERRYIGGHGRRTFRHYRGTRILGDVSNVNAYLRTRGRS